MVYLSRYEPENESTAKLSALISSFLDKPYKNYRLHFIKYKRFNFRNSKT